MGFGEGGIRGAYAQSSQERCSVTVDCNAHSSSWTSRHLPRTCMCYTLLMFSVLASFRHLYDTYAAPQSAPRAAPASPPARTCPEQGSICYKHVCFTLC